MGVNRMVGTPWHVERFTREEGDDRRHRSRCANYRKSDAHCSQYSGKCRGSAHCPYYKECGSETEETPVFKPKKEEKMSDVEGRRVFPIGSRVVHKSYGSGTVKEIANGKITVAFDYGKETLLGLDICVKNKLLKKE